MQLGDLNSSLLDLLVGMAAPTKGGLAGTAPDAAAFAESLSAALEAGSALGGARPIPAPTEDDPAPAEELAVLVMGEGPRILDPAAGLSAGVTALPAEAPGDPDVDPVAPPAPQSHARGDQAEPTPAILSVPPSEGTSADASAAPPDPLALLLASPIGTTVQETPVPASEPPALPADAPTPALPAAWETMPTPTDGASKEGADTRPATSTVLRAVTESTPAPTPSVEGGPDRLPRAEVATLLERIELRTSPSSEAIGSLRARLRPEDLGRSLAIRSLASAAPTEPTAASRMGAPAVAPAAATDPHEPSVARPIPATPAAIAVAALAGSAVVASDSSATSSPKTTASEIAPAVSPSALDPAVEKETSSRPDPAPRPVAAPAAPTAVQSGTAQGDGDASSSSGDADTPPEPDLAPTGPPAPSGESSPSTPAATPRGADLQMQARQAMARTVVRMGEDQLLASARPQTATVQLRPSHLGALRIEVHQTPQRTLEITLTASVPETQRALEADADDMLDALRSQKLDVSRVSVRADGERPDADPRGRNDFFRNRDSRDPRDPSFAHGEGNPDRESGEHSRDGRHPSHADPTDYRYWEAVR